MRKFLVNDSNVNGQPSARSVWNSLLTDYDVFLICWLTIITVQNEREQDCSCCSPNVIYLATGRGRNHTSGCHGWETEWLREKKSSSTAHQCDISLIPTSCLFWDKPKLLKFPSAQLIRKSLLSNTTICCFEWGLACWYCVCTVKLQSVSPLHKGDNPQHKKTVSLIEGVADGRWTKPQCSIWSEQRPKKGSLNHIKCRTISVFYNITLFFSAPLAVAMRC